MNSALRGTAANVEAWERWPTDKTMQQLGDGSGDKLLSLSSPLSSMSTCCAELSGDTPFIGLALMQMQAYAGKWKPNAKKRVVNDPRGG